MSNISISNLRSSSSDPFTDAENFMHEISDKELVSITGGFIVSDIIKAIGDSLTTIARMG
jgi:bacteriocin-like protein